MLKNTQRSSEPSVLDRTPSLLDVPMNRTSSPDRLPAVRTAVFDILVYRLYVLLQLVVQWKSSRAHPTSERLNTVHRVFPVHVAGQIQRGGEPHVAGGTGVVGRPVAEVVLAQGSGVLERLPAGLTDVFFKIGVGHSMSCQVAPR